MERPLALTSPMIGGFEVAAIVVFVATLMLFGTMHCIATGMGTRALGVDRLPTYEALFAGMALTLVLALLQFLV